MPYRVYHADAATDAEPYNVVALSGDVRWPDVAGALRALYLDPTFPRGGGVLWDATEVAVVDIRPGDLPEARAVFLEVAEARQGGRTAFLVGPGSDEEIWWLLPHLGPPSSREFRVFRHPSEAFCFLGVDDLRPHRGLRAA